MTNGAWFVTIIMVTSALSLGVQTSAHDHKEDQPAEKEHEHNAEEKDHDHSTDEKAGHEAKESEESESSKVGPDKGILEVDEHEGFKLSPEALKNFDIKTQKLRGKGPWSLTKKAQVRTGEETNFFRVREGFFKRIDFQVVRKTNEEVFVDSKQLQDGDEIVVSGLGFLRIAELAAFGGAPEGHSH
jgi:hypothetical protein